MAENILLFRAWTVVLMLLSVGLLTFGLYNMRQDTEPRTKVLENKEFRLPTPHGGGPHRPTPQPQPETPATPAPSATEPSLMTSATSIADLIYSLATPYMTIGDYRLRRGEFLARQQRPPQAP
jgi:hypothetical protein